MDEAAEARARQAREAEIAQWERDGSTREGYEAQNRADRGYPEK